MMIRIISTYLLTNLYLCFALNPIHESTYDLTPQFKAFEFHKFTFRMDGGFHLEGKQKLRLPLTGTYSPDPQWEFGLGLKARWLSEPNNFRHIVIGVKHQLFKQLMLQGDLLWGVANYAGDAITLTALTPFDWNKSFSSPFQFRLGFLDALVFTPGFMALEMGTYPAWQPHPAVKFEAGYFLNSQFGDFISNFGMNLQPAIYFEISDKIFLKSGFLWGLAGENRSNFRFDFSMRFLI